MVIVITGNPGVGKHTVAEKLSKELEMSILDINKIAKESKLLEPDEETNDLDIEKFKPILKNLLEENCIIVGHLAPYLLKKSDITLAIVLRKNPYKLIPIYEKRNYSLEKTKDNAGSEALGIIAHDAIEHFGEEKTFEINVTEKTVDMIVKEIGDINKGNFKSQKIDWLQTIVKNNDLDTFFSY